MFHLTIEVPTRQGVTLRGLRYAPATSPAPTVMALTPYGADRFHPDGKLFAARGFHFVSLDTCGRGDSDGEFLPFVHDAADGHDAVEWLADQPWSRGDVVLYGGSYCGFVQWAIAGTRPAGLRAIAPTAAVYPGIDFPMEGNVVLPYAVRWLSYVEGRRANRLTFEDEPFWYAAARAAIAGNRPLRDLDLASVSQRLPVFQDWLNHPQLDEYWDSLIPLAQRAEVTMPVLTVTGQYDDDQLGALRYHDEHIAAVAPEIAERHQVVIGPWDHMNTRHGARSFGGLTFAESSEIDIRALHADWFDWVLGRGPKPSFLTDRVVYFHSGEDRWRSGPDIPDSPPFLTLYPVGPQLLSSTAPAATQRFELKADPRNAASESRDPPTLDTYFTDGAALRQTDNPSLIHTSAPLPQAVDLSGCYRVHLTLAADIPDFDLLLSVYRLTADDTTILLGETIFRARYRSSLRQASPWPIGSPVPISRTGRFKSLRLQTGDRIATVLRSPHRVYETNFQTGGAVSSETLADATPGTIQVIQDPAQPSYLAFPLG